MKLGVDMSLRDYFYNIKLYKTNSDSKYFKYNESTEIKITKIEKHYSGAPKEGNIFKIAYQYFTRKQKSKQCKFQISTYEVEVYSTKDMKQVSIPIQRFEFGKAILFYELSTKKTSSLNKKGKTLDTAHSQQDVQFNAAKPTNNNGAHSDIRTVTDGEFPLETNTPVYYCFHKLKTVADLPSNQLKDFILLEK